MCINTKYRMSIIEKVFKYEATELPVIKYKDEIWFKAVAVATILKYTNQRKVIHDHVDPEDKKKLSELVSETKQNESFPLKTGPQKGNEGNSLYLSKSGLDSLVLHSKLESACAFKRWVMTQILLSIRKTGRYNYCTNHKYNSMLAFKIENETDLHVNIIHFLKKRYPHSLFTVTLGKNQCTSTMRIDSFKKGYLHGSPRSNN